MLAIKEINQGFDFQAGFANNFSRCVWEYIKRYPRVSIRVSIGAGVLTTCNWLSKLFKNLKLDFLNISIS
jgi:hypothetical protein